MAAENYPAVTFERYADDAGHCKSEAQARQMLSAITQPMAQVGLELHPDKTRMVYCKDSNRTGSYENERFNLLGHADLRVMPTSARTSL